MAKIDALLQKLRDQPKTVDGHWNDQRTRWLKDLEDLRGNVETWLELATKEGLLKLQRQTVSIDEPDTGRYDAPALDIHVVKSGRRVQLEPKALRIAGIIPLGGKRMVGAQGRVDLSLGAGRVTLLRKVDHGVSRWLIVPLAGEAVELDEEAFLAALDELVD
jgi:hypothetical protein